VGTMREETAVTDIYHYYGVQQVFSIVRLGWFKWFGRTYLSGLLATLNTRRKQYRLALSRCVPSAFFAALFNVPVIFEFHQPISDSGRLSRLNEFLFKRMIRRKSFVGFVAITHALKAHYLERYPDLDGRICVAPDGSDP